MSISEIYSLMTYGPMGAVLIASVGLLVPFSFTVLALLWRHGSRPWKKEE